LKGYGDNAVQLLQHSGCTIVGSPSQLAGVEVKAVHALEKFVKMILISKELTVSQL
jgi:hypothetical protein